MVESEIVPDGLIEMEQILQKAEVGRLALCKNSTPYIIPLNFAYLKGKVGFHCDWKGKKLDIMSQNPNCCFEVDEYVGEVNYHYDALCHLDYDSVIASGKARIEKDPDAIWEFFQVLHAKYKEIYRKPIENGGKVFDRKRVSEACCVIIDVEELTGRRERTTEGKLNKITWKHRF
jgi:nitroimidazol reductase NimA-like FMN-containing flavoprotein (pyridoxamine 5'-phosphate oxidase superfamily)